VIECAATPLILIVGLLSKSETFPIDALKEMDSLLTTHGFRKEVSTVVQPSKEFSITYDGPDAKRETIVELLRPVAEKSKLEVKIELDESVKFP